MEDLESILGILGNPTRIRIIDRLCYGPSYLMDLVRELDANPQAIFRHLKMLERSGFLESWQDRESNRKYYSLSKGLKVVVDIDPNGLRGEVKETRITRKKRSKEEPETRDILEELTQIEGQLEKLERSRRILAKRRIELLKKASEGIF